MNPFSYIQLALAGVLAVENVLGHQVPGETKQQLVLASIEAIAKAAEGSPDPTVAGAGAIAEIATPVVAGLVDALVGVFNRSGAFKHNAPAVPAAQGAGAAAPAGTATVNAGEQPIMFRPVVAPAPAKA